MHRVRVLACVFLVSLPALALAQTAPPVPPLHEETFEVAFVGVAGNASSSTFGLGADIIARPSVWLVRHKVSFVRNESDGVLTAKALEYLGRLQRSFRARASVFGEYSFFRDRFAGIAPRHLVTGGVTVDVLDRSVQKLSVDVGAGHVSERRLSGANISSGSWSAGAAYKVKMSASATVTDELRLSGVFDRRENWRLENGVAVTASLVAGLSLKVSYGIRYANFPPEGFRRTDTVTSVSLVAKFATPR